MNLVGFQISEMEQAYKVAIGFKHCSQWHRKTGKELKETANNDASLSQSTLQ